MKDLPSSLEAERAVLGMLLSKAKQTPSDIAALTEEDFYRSAHQMLFKAIANLYREGTAADMVTVTESLRASGKLEAVGGIAFITSLVGDVLSLQNMDEYIAIVREKRRLRYLARTFDELARDACRGENTVEKLLERCQRAMRNAQEAARPILLGAVGTKKCNAPRIKPAAAPAIADFKTLLCKTVASLFANTEPASLAIYSLGLCSCSEMDTWLRENLLQRGIDLDMVRCSSVLLSDSVFSLPNLFASLRCLRQSEGERFSIAVLDTWLLFQANTLHPSKVAYMVSSFRNLADELGISIVMAVHASSTADFPKLGIMY